MTKHSNTRLPLLAALALTALLPSCTEREAMPGDGSGWVTFRVQRDSAVEAVTTKSDSGDERPIALTILDRHSFEVFSCEDLSEVTSPIELAASTYTATATCGTLSAAVFDSPFYSGSGQFEIIPDEVTTLSLTLTLDVVKVTASFSDDFDDPALFTDYSLTVSNGLDSLVFDSSTEDREAYFSVTGTLSYRLELTNTTGESYTLSKEYTDVVARQYYAFSFSVEAKPDNPDGGLEFTIVVDDSLTDINDSFVIEVEDGPAVGAISANSWSRFATLLGRWSGDEPEGLRFEYRLSGDEDWTGVDADLTIDEEERSFTANLYGLTPETDYEFRAISDYDPETDPVSFTTEDEQTVPNLDFDTWYDVGSYWSPNTDGDNIIWDTANKGSSTLNVIPTSREEENLAVSGEGKYAAKMESKVVNAVVLKKFAAGNIYTGQFNKISGLGADLYWGYAFTSRPVGLHGWYDYTPVAIDYADDPYTDLKGTTDVGSIQIFLTDWDSPFEINTSNSVFVDFTADYIIARGVLYLDQTDGYTEFTLPLEYYDTSRTPTYIVISCAASAYGDYFTGGVGSTLYVDEFSLVYDPLELPD